MKSGAQSKRIPIDLRVGSIHVTNNFGEIRVVDYINAKKIMVEFINTGYKTWAQSIQIRLGTIKDKNAPLILGVGFIGDGVYTKKSNRSAYYCWTGMLERCYSEKSREKYPTYADCTVDERWHSFQSFCEFYEKNHPKSGERYEIDKDIKIKGNRIYSPETCMFVTTQQNSEAAQAKWYKFKSPDGEIVEIYNLSKFCRSKGLNSGHMSAVSLGKLNHHHGWTKSD